jgi:formylglycine-generating enzyme required for sulfatase activity
METLPGFLLSFILLFGLGTWAGPYSEPEVLVAAGTYSPFFRDQGESDQKIGSLWVDRFPVTNENFLRYLKTHPEWRKSHVQQIFVDPGYLENWISDLAFAKNLASKPVTGISWFAARHYCQSQNKRLLTTAEWEYVSRAQDPEVLKLILNWYGQTNEALKNVTDAPVNSLGLVGMHGLIWEWVEDFSSAIVSGDSRSSNETSRSMFCGSGALAARDPTQYATFMRYAYRSSLKANSTGRNLGFRCTHSLHTEGSNEKN